MDHKQIAIDLATGKDVVILSDSDLAIVRAELREIKKNTTKVLSQIKERLSK